MAPRTRILALRGVAVIAALHFGGSPQVQAVERNETTYVSIEKGELIIRASAGVQNRIVIRDYADGLIWISDAARVPIKATAGWQCYSWGDHFLCPPCLINRISVAAGDRNDSVDNNSSMPSRMFGEQGDDLMFGGPKKDQLVGGPGNDQLVADGSAGDVLSGGEGNDRLFGGDGPDWLEGGGGMDSADGRGGTDECGAESETNCEGELRLNPRPIPYPPSPIPFPK